MAHSFRSVTLDEVGSTNTEAFERARAGERGPLWVVARRQTQGRGRSGHRWTSERGNLYASLLQRFDCPHGVVHQLSLAAGVAVAGAIRIAAGAEKIPELRLKWPNDVLIGKAKCAGILPESQIGGGRTEVIAVVGIGINLASHPAHLGRAATDLATHGVKVPPEAMLSFLAENMGRWLGIWDGGKGFARVRSVWLEHGTAAGESLTVDTGKERVAGTFLDLDADGALLMRDTHGAERRLTFGDVTFDRPRSGSGG